MINSSTNPSWLLIYRTNSHKSLKSLFDKASKKLETTTIKNPAKIFTKKIDRVETSLKESSRDMSLFGFKSSTIVALVLFILFGLSKGESCCEITVEAFGNVMEMSQ
ncbi:calcium load-activated calcium channel [Citrus sinensis]|uniref:Calcium load-activated calcium channel n=1 Tax=Citrus sinensis TaxID=2711 RepID=A0ACB8JET7_CITSI|nr:calcium load-activated calcium channel [Citrus sinensis]